MGLLLTVIVILLIRAILLLNHSHDPALLILTHPFCPVPIRGHKLLRFLHSSARRPNGRVYLVQTGHRRAHDGISAADKLSHALPQQALPFLLLFPRHSIVLTVYLAELVQIIVQIVITTVIIILLLFFATFRVVLCDAEAGGSVGFRGGQLNGARIDQHFRLLDAGGRLRLFCAVVVKICFGFLLFFLRVVVAAAFVEDIVNVYIWKV